jgi:RNA polymerase sigma factor (sigma-70 family)
MPGSPSGCRAGRGHRPARRPDLTPERAALFDSCLRMAYKFAAQAFRRRRWAFGGDREAASSAALEVLWVAALNYDPSRGASFATYAHNCLSLRIGRCGEHGYDPHREEWEGRRREAERGYAMEREARRRTEGRLVGGADDAREAVAAAMPRLQPRLREAAALQLEGDGYREAAARLGVTRQAYAERLKRARAEIARIITEAADGR